MADRLPKPFSLAELVQGADRRPLAQFWLAAPSEALASLWQSEVGEVSRHLISHPYPSSGPAAAGHQRLAAALQRQLISSPKAENTATFLALLLLAGDQPPVLQLAPALLPWLETWWQPQRAQTLQHHRDQDNWAQGPCTPLSLEALADQLSRCNAIRRRANLLLIQPHDEPIAAALRDDRLLLVRLLCRASEQELHDLISRPASRLPLLYRSLLHCGLRDQPLVAEERDQLSALLPPPGAATESLALPQLLAQLLLLPPLAAGKALETASTPPWFSPWTTVLFDLPPCQQPATPSAPAPADAPPAEPALSVDLGCGSTIRNPFRAARVIGVDAAITAEGVITQWVGFQPLNLADSSVDVVTAVDFLQFLPRFLLADGQVHNPFVRALNDIWRILRPDGLFYAETPAHPHAEAFANPAHLNVISEDTVQYFARLPSADGQPSAVQALALGREQGFAGQFQLLDQHWQGTRLCWTLRCEKPGTSRP
jgi:hypothetical protein